MKTLLVLGATPFQTPIVTRARRMGHHVITMDNVPGNPAHRQANESAMVSIADPEAVLAFARQRGIDGILTGGSEMGLEALGLVCDELGLAGVSRAQALDLTHKDRFRSFQKNHRLPHPDFSVFSDWDDFAGVAQGLTGEFILKPVDRSGSKGVFVLGLTAEQDPTGYRQEFAHALEQSLCGRVVLERYLTGTEYGGDGFMREGELISFIITNKSLTRAPDHVPTGHTIPSRLAARTRHAVQVAVKQVLDLSAFRNGPFNFDVMIDGGDQVTIIEIGPRFGGNGIPEIIGLGAGFDEVEASIIYALEGTPPDVRARQNDAITPTGSRILGCEKAGVLHHMTPIETMKQKHAPGLIDLAYDFQVGDRVEKFTQGNFRVGQIIATAPDLTLLDQLLDRITADIDLQVR